MPETSETVRRVVSESKATIRERKANGEHPSPTQLELVRTAADEYAAAGLVPVPLLTGLKKTFRKGWSTKSAEELRGGFNGEYTNIGISWRGRCTVDLDSPEAIALWHVFLPPTKYISRPLKPISQLLYKAKLPTKRYDTSKGGRIIELLGEGAQSMVAPSMHPDGERLTWGGEKQTVSIKADDLLRRVDILAACVTILLYWEEGSRDELATITCCLLQDAGVELEVTKAVIKAFIDHGGCDEDDRKTLEGKAKNVYQRKASAKRFGIPKLKEIASGKDAEKARLWLLAANEPVFDWPEPVALVPERVTIPDWPDDFLPGAFNSWAKDVSKRQGSHIDYVAAALIASVAAAAGAQVYTQPKQHDDQFKIHCNIWAACVGDPGEKKSPAIKEGLTGINAVQQDARAVFEAQMVEYIKECEEYDEAKKAKTELPEKPIKPKKMDAVIHGATTEAYAESLAHNPQGSLLHYEELAGLIKSANQYKGGSGDDIEFLLKCFDGGPHNIRRKTEGKDVYVSSCYASVIGTIQPEVTREHLINEDKQANGFAARFGVMTWPEMRDFDFVDADPDHDSRRAVTELIRKIRADFGPHEEDGEVEKYVFKFSKPGSVAFAKWYVQHSVEVHGTESPLKQHFSKYDGLVIRLSQVHFLMTGNYKRELKDEF